MPASTGKKIAIQNRRARHEYFVEDRVEAGLVLSGTEVKSLRKGRGNLQDLSLIHISLSAIMG